MYYFVVLFAPLLIAVVFGQAQMTTLKYSALFLFISINLISGFRNLLISGLLLIMFFNIRSVLQTKRTYLIVLLAILVVALSLFQGVREAVNPDTLISNTPKSFIESLNRSYPLSSMSLIILKDVQEQPESLLSLFIHPFFLIYKSLFHQSFPLSFDEYRVSEILYRPLLVWRGTPHFEPTGFSISIVPYSLLYRPYGLPLFAYLLSLMLARGCLLISSLSYSHRLLGSILLSAALSLLFESFVEGYKLLVYSMLLFLLIIALGSLYRFISSKTSVV
jgi:hypothetical protein